MNDEQIIRSYMGSYIAELSIDQQNIYVCYWNFLPEADVFRHLQSLFPSRHIKTDRMFTANAKRQAIIAIPDDDVMNISNEALDKHLNLNTYLFNEMAIWSRI